MVSYEASKGCVSLNQYFTRPQKVRSTSKDSLQNHDDRFSQVRLVELLLKNAPQGLTDCELQQCLRSSEVFLPLSSVSARRNDVNRLYRETKGLVVLNIDGEKRKNPQTNKSCLVWRYVKK